MIVIGGDSESFMRFVKMHGIGNDYIYVDCLSRPVPANPGEVSRRIADRHFGVGADGLVLICPPEQTGHDARMRMFNSDGSESEMCGNAVRCIAKYLVDRRLNANDTLIIETGRGPLKVAVETEGGRVRRATVNMQPPILEAARIPTTLRGNPPIDQPIEVAGRPFNVTCVSMGNPHAVIFLDERPTDEHVLQWGPKLEAHPAFPRKANIEFAFVRSPTEIDMRVWERGSGETLACGTGACAVCVAGSLSGRTEKRVLIHLRGGDLEIEWREDGVYKTGPAVEICTGDYHSDS
jgi:diaminopimelate epimerase